MKKFVTAALFAALMLASVVAVSANEVIRVTIEGQQVDFPGEQGPVIVDGRTLVPVRGVFEHLGFDVDWDEDARSAVLVREGVLVTLTLESDVFVINGENRNLEVAAQLIGDRTMIPIRAVVESVGYYVDWDDATRTVIISSGPIVGAVVPDASAVVATVNGIPITARDARFRARQAEELFFQGYGALLGGFMIDYSWEISEGLTFARYLQERAVMIAGLFILYQEFADEHNLTLTQDIINFIRDDINNAVEMFGVAQFNSALQETGIHDRAHLEEIMQSIEIVNIVINTIVSDSDMFLPFEQYMAEIEEPVAAKHILIVGDYFDTDEELEAFAAELLERAVGGEDFDMLVSEYGQDPGMVQNPEGYTFVSGVMVPEFDEATRALEIGEISGLVRSAFGIHIIKRVEPDMDNVMFSHGIGTPPTLDERMAEAVSIGFEYKLENAEIVFLPTLSDVRVEP